MNEVPADIFSTIAARWKDIATVFVVIVALAVAYLHLAQRQYTASAVLAPSDAELNMLTGVSGTSDLGSLSLGRIGFGLGSEDPKFAALLQQLTSNMTARTLLNDDRIKAAIYETSWDAHSHTFHPPQGFAYGLVQVMKAALGLNPWHAPTAADLQRYLSQNVVAREIGVSGLYSVSYASKAPDFARYFLSRVLAVSDDYLRQVKLARATAYVRYLDQRLKGVTDLDQRQAMLRLRSRQENFVMAASVNLPFSADINDPPIAPSRPTWPNVLIIAVITLFFGGGLAAAVGVFFHPYEAIRRRFAGTPPKRSFTSPSALQPDHGRPGTYS
ncbi:MAG TPA: Wzz/FepE/Etk N-terminal domain-containing protein [Rhizomicrobium sp.]